MSCSFGPAVHGTTPNDLLQSDHIEMTVAAPGRKKVIVLRDNYSHWFGFSALAHTSAGNAAGAIAD